MAKNKNAVSAEQRPQPSAVSRRTSSPAWSRRPSREAAGDARRDGARKGQQKRFGHN